MAEAPHLLIVDDDDRLRLLLKRFLTAGGYRVTAAPDVPTARKLRQTMAFDLAILDVMMPGEDGFALLSDIRSKDKLPVIMLTARDEVSDKREGFDRGADDYLIKPFEPEELTMRIAAILRRSMRGPVAPPLKLSGLTFDISKGELRRGDGRVYLTEAEARLLTLLAQNCGEAMSRTVLAENADLGSERSVDVQVTRLRRKIEPDPRKPVYLQTVRGIGYRLIVD